MRNLLETSRKVLTKDEDLTLNEVSDKEINAVKKLSKDIEKVKKDYFKIAKMGDKTLKDTKYNKKYESILKAQQEILSLIGELSNQKMMQKEVNEGMMDLDKARKLPDAVQKQILDAKKEYDRTWDGVFVPMGKEGSSQRKEYERRGKIFKAASKKYKDLLKKHKVATFK